MAGNELRSCLESLEQQARALRNQGAIPHPDFRLDCSENVPGGRKYHRKRYKAGAIGPTGKHSEVVSKEVYQQLRKQLQLGRRLRWIEKQISELVQQIDCTAAGDQQQFKPGQKVRFWVMWFGNRVEMEGLVVSDRGDAIQVATVLSNGLTAIEVPPTQLLTHC